ncbi:MAG TPA: response regulator [Bryobacteraceae bacterium]|nr:response regulator [Bryobacteraceae bacterium]
MNGPVNMRTLIVDDEPVARQILREGLNALGGVEIIGEAADGQMALTLIHSLEPDLVFLDLQMPVLGGFEMLSRLQGPRLPVIVIVTAYDQHAIRAFEAGAIDYLLKPVSEARLGQSLERARRLSQSRLQVVESVAQLQDAAPSPASNPGAARVRKIVGKLNEEYFLLNPNEVLAFQAEGDITWIITMKQRYQATLNLKGIEERLAGSLFRRIHRNALVNVNQIRKMSMITSQRWLVTLHNGQEFVASKRMVKSVRDVLSW